MTNLSSDRGLRLAQTRFVFVPVRKARGLNWSEMAFDGRRVLRMFIGVAETFLEVDEQ